MSLVKAHAEQKQVMLQPNWAPRVQVTRSASE